MNNKEQFYPHHKGESIKFRYNGKILNGIIVGYIFYGADKGCVCPAYIVKANIKKWLKIKEYQFIVQNWEVKE